MRRPFEQAPFVTLAWAVWTALSAACSNVDVPRDRGGNFATCCEGRGTCVARGLVASDQRKRLSQDSCGESLLCAPSELVLRGPLHPKACTTEALGAEGRCLPPCLPEVANRKGVARDDCDAGYLCAPCFDPLTGDATGACALGEDPGPSKSPETFADCCGDFGRCIPETLVDTDDRSSLSRDTCAAGDALCVPEALALDESWAPASCGVDATGAEGRCLPACLPGVARRAAKLSRSSCPSSELCAPCFDPVSGDATGACSIGGDIGSEQPKVVFGDCCGGLGHCVPSPLVSSADRARLAQDSCGIPSDLCVPDALAADDNARVAPCLVSAFGAEGRCLPACLPEVSARAVHLARESCATGELCSPCFDPLSGASTGACGLGGDPGTMQPPVVFATCCGDLGRCVPSPLSLKMTASASPQIPAKTRRNSVFPRAWHWQTITSHLPV